jgi:hypothetical protein
LDIERHLIAEIVANGKLGDVIDAGISADYFDDNLNRKLFEIILEHHLQYGRVPDLDILHKDYPTVTLPPADKPLGYLLQEMRDNRTGMILEDAMTDAVGLLKTKDFAQCLDVLGRTVTQVEREVPRAHFEDYTATSDSDWMAEYAELRKRDGHLLGIPTGFDSVDYVTQGFQPQQLITFVGLPKAGKSTLLLLSAMAAHACAYRPLLVGFEMSHTEQKYRHAAFLAHISHTRLRTGRLTPDEEKRLKRAIRQLNSMPEFWGSTDVNSATTLTGLHTQIERYRPDIVFVDGVYMMRDEEGEPQGSSQALTNITRVMKWLAQNMDIPIVQSIQALSWKTDKRRGLTADSIGYSSSFLQDSDGVIGVEKTPIDDINKLKVLALRSGPLMEKYIRWDWDTGTFEELEDDPFAKESQESADAKSGF